VFSHVKTRITVSHFVFWNSARRNHLRSGCSSLVKELQLQL
jgi:hypothetical protein